MRITNDFFGDIEEKNREFVLNKLNYFNDTIKSSNCLKDIPSGFWIRQIIGTDVYKFRVNNGDRILFTFDKMNNNEVVFLKYCNHDSQIVEGKNINKTINMHLEKSLELNFNSYEDNEDDAIKFNIDNYIKRYLSIGLENLISIVLDDEYIGIILDDDNDDYLYYLNESQFDCLKVLGKPIIISGCAGSGKTMIGVHKLILNNELNIKSAYITHSPLLKDTAESYFSKFKKSENNNVDFININEYCAKILNLDISKIINYREFELWLLKECGRFNDLSPILIYNEINNKNILKEKYICDYFNDKELEFINKVYVKYETWLKENNYLDEVKLLNLTLNAIDTNKIKLPKYDYIFVDETQDLTSNHIKIICSILSIKENIIFSGDVNQIINNSNFDFKLLKSYFYKEDIKYVEKFINKNYRNGSGIVEFINNLIELRKSKIGKLKNIYDAHEEYVRTGKKPFVIPYKPENMKNIIEEVNERDYCALVVPTNIEKHNLIIGGANEAKVFTINEIKGLEYKNIFCINFISAYKRYWKMIKNGSDKEYLRYFINSLYVGITRGINIVGLIDKDYRMIKELFGKEYVEDLEEINVELLEMTKVSTINGWNREGRRLEITSNYGKAFYAYKRANNKEGMLRCKKEIEKIKGNRLTTILGKKNETSIRIEKTTGALEYNDIYLTLENIFNKNFVYPKGTIEFVLQCNDDTVSIWNEDNINKHNAIYRISQSFIDIRQTVLKAKKNKITIHMNLFYNDEPLRLKNSQNEEVNLIKAIIVKSNKKSVSLKISYDYLDDLNLGEAINKGFKDYTDIEEEEDYKTFDSEYSVDRIFNLVERANSLIYSQRYNEAIDIYNNILLYEFDNFINELSKLHSTDGLCNKLEIEAGSIEELKNYFLAEFNNNLGAAYNLIGLHDKAFKCLNKSIEVMPLKYPNAYLTLGDIFLDTNDYDNALSCFEKGIELGDKRGYKGIAKINMIKKEFIMSMEYINKFLNEFPVDMDGHTKRIKAFVQLLMDMVKNKNKYSRKDIIIYSKDANDSYTYLKTKYDNTESTLELLYLFENIYDNGIKWDMILPLYQQVKEYC